MQRYMNGMSNGGAVQASLGEALDNDTLRAVTPSLFAVEAHESRSDRFAPIPTIDIVNGLRREGFEPFFAQQARTRDASRHEFTRHVIRMRHRSLARDNGEAFEIILSNANDGSAAYQMLPGFFRFVCMIGLFVGEAFEPIKVRHAGAAMDKVIEGAYTVLNDAPRLVESVDRFKGIDLNPHQRDALATLTHMTRFPDAWEVGEDGRPVQVHGKAPVNPDRMLQARRTSDRATDLWTTFNVLQENAVKGGQRGWIEGAKGTRRAKVRAVNGIAHNADLNRKIWTLADEMAAIATA